MAALPESLAQDHSLLLDTVRRAGAVALKYFHRDVKHWDKGNDNPVTEADIAVDTLLRERLTGARPDYGWLSEETADDPSRMERRRVWIADPIDGTRAFMRQVPEFTVAVALVEDGRPILGAVYNPAKDEFFEAARGAGARLNGQRIRPSEVSDPGEAHFLTARRNMTYFKWPKHGDDMLCTWMNSIAYRMALVASGRFDAAISMAGKHDWDIAAADLILTEAGARCTTNTDETFRYNQERPRHRNVIACGANLHPALLRVLA
ncbi:MAG: 3'(2'),5'-bisphosphate nucleotidase CysQ [Pseudomonadota bacterium]|nr:3'(2'),5'-bisphosphate nucleotidase CysQ [Pseudomonadota bacterium]